MSSLPGFVTSASSSPYSVGVRCTCSPSSVTRRFGRSTSSASNAQHRRRGLVGLLAAHRRAGAREQLLHAERLRDVVVGPGVERRDLVGLRLAHREHDHRHVAEARGRAGSPRCRRCRAARGRAARGRAPARRRRRRLPRRCRPSRPRSRAPRGSCAAPAGSAARRRPRAPASRARLRPSRSLAARQLGVISQASGRRCDRDLEHERRAALGRVLDPDASAVRRDDRVRDREPEAGARVSRGSTRHGRRPRRPARDRRARCPGPGR